MLIAWVVAALFLFYVGPILAMGTIVTVSLWFRRSRQLPVIVFHQLLPSRCRAAILVAKAIRSLWVRCQKVVLLGGFSFGDGYVQSDSNCAEFTPGVHREQLSTEGVDPAFTFLWKATCPNDESVESGGEVNLINRHFGELTSGDVLEIVLVGLPTHMWRVWWLYWCYNRLRRRLLGDRRRIRLVGVRYVNPLSMGVKWLLGEPMRFWVNLVDPFGVWIAGRIVSSRRESTKSIRRRGTTN